MILDNALGIHPKALELRAHRSEILAANLANADTPGYKARDFDFGAVLQNELPAVPMTTTRTGHLQPDGGLVTGWQTQYRVPSQPSLDGNTVDSQIEYGNFASNALEYQASLRFLNGKIKGLLLAIKGQ
jgi:flagellar basal-body rod protein FlgB